MELNSLKEQKGLKMIREVRNITSEAHQTHSLFYNDVQAELELRFIPQVGQWFISCTIGDKAIKNAKLSVGVLHMVSRNMPIDFIVVDNSGEDLDPFLSTDFTSGRCTLLMLDDESMTDLRGVEV